MDFVWFIIIYIKNNLKGVEKVNSKFKKKLKDNGQSLKWFWSVYLKKTVSYQYFIMQINENAEMREDVELAITNFMMGVDKNES